MYIESEELDEQVRGHAITFVKGDPNPQNQYKTNRLYKLPKCFSLVPKGAKAQFPENCIFKRL